MNDPSARWCRPGTYLSYLAFALCCVSLPAATAANPREEEAMMAARDGVELATSIYLPAEAPGPLPCVLARTPYNKDGARGLARQFVERGYAFVAQDCRGKFKSKGKYDPFTTDHLDGYDAVEWIASRPWSNGKVGMMGASALGITSQLAATQAPPHLLCAYVIVAENSARTNTVYMGGILCFQLFTFDSPATCSSTWTPRLFATTTSRSLSPLTSPRTNWVPIPTPRFMRCRVKVGGLPLLTSNQ